MGRERSKKIGRKARGGGLEREERKAKQRSGKGQYMKGRGRERSET